MKQWFMQPTQKPGSLVRLFCLPFAGGSASIFRNWGRTLGPSVDVYPVQLPGRASRFNEPAFKTVEAATDALAIALLPVLDKPYMLFGHSMGAVLAFELARKLAANGVGEPAHLFVSGRRAPHIPNEGALMYPLPHAEFIGRLRTLDGTPPAVLENPELLALALPLLRADFELVETYAFRSGLTLRCPITGFGGTRDKDTPLAVVEPWRRYTDGPFGLHTFDGGHFFIDSHEAQLLHTIETSISQTFAQSPVVAARVDA